MEKKSLSLQYTEGDNIQELAADDLDLVNQAIAFAANAYAPYSNFQVSACLRLEDGTIVKGANVENGSFPVSICAERTLLSHTVSNYPSKKIKTIAIYVDKAVGNPVPPCGLCRQTLLEVELRQKSPMKLILVAKEGKYLLFDKAADLLPFFFDGSVL